MPTEAQNQIVKQFRPTYNAYILHLIHKSWPKAEIELLKANYTARGVKAIIRDKNDNQEYILEIYPNEGEQNG